MKKVALAITIIAMNAASASAADLAPIYGKTPIVNPVFSWTGFYIGEDIGWGWAKTSATTVEQGAVAGNADLQSFGLKGNGILGGVHAGYNWQAAPKWVLGIEADVDATGIKSNASSGLTLFGGTPVEAVIPGATSNNLVRQNVDWLSSIRGRAGYADGNLLFFLTGGAALGGLRQSATQNFAVGGLGAATWPFSSNTTSTGWVVGAGAEYALNNNWFIRQEYLYYSLRGTTGTGFPIPAAGAPGTSFVDNFGRTTIHTVRVGVSYRFGGAQVARY